MPNVSIEYYGVTGTGRNVTEAKRDAGEQIRKALEGDYTPSLIHWRQYTVLMWREPKTGWGYRISHPDEQGAEVRERMWHNCTREDHDELLVSIAHHIGSIARPNDENPTLTRPLFEALVRRGTDREFTQFCERAKRDYTFQTRYRYAKDALGMTDSQAHDWAGMGPATYEFWKGTEGLFTVPSWEK